MEIHTCRRSQRVTCAVCSVLKVGGVFILVTYGDPEHRIPALFPLSHRWSIDADRLRASSFLPSGVFVSCPRAMWTPLTIPEGSGSRCTWVYIMKKTA